MSNATILPEWKHALSEMEKLGIKYGSTFSLEWFEKTLKQTRDTVEFAMSIHQIRVHLRTRGMNLTSIGQNGQGWFIAPPQTNAHEMLRMQRKAIRAMQQGVILGTNTPLEILEAADRKRHEGVLERLAIRSALISRRDIKSLK
jgi:hypothetical protein